MAAIPAISDFTDALVTEGEFKTALSGLHDYLTGLLGTAGTQAAGQAAFGALLGAGVTTRTTAYTILAADRGKVFACTGTFSLALTAAATLGAGFAVAVSNVSTGAITIDPNGAETINGAATYVVPANTSAIIACTGSAWVVIGGDPFVKVTGTPSNSTYLRGDYTWSSITMPSTAFDGVGSYAVLYEAIDATTSTSTSRAAGYTQSGSNLRYLAADLGTAGMSLSAPLTNTILTFPTSGTPTAVSGTWRLMHRLSAVFFNDPTYAWYPGLWVRIS